MSHATTGRFAAFGLLVAGLVVGCVAGCSNVKPEGSANATGGRQERQRQFKSSGVEIRYIVEGAGERVVLIHGYGVGAKENWIDSGLIKELAKDYRVIALDLRGHGKSGKPHQPSKYGVHMAEDVIRLLDHLQIRKAHMIGWSMGSSVLMKLLAEHADRVLTATIGGSGGMRKELVHSKWAQEIPKSLDSGLSYGEALVANWRLLDESPLDDDMKSRLLVEFGDRDTKALAAVIRSWKELEVSDEAIRGMKVPTLIIYGSREFPVNLGAIEDLRPLMPQSTFFEIKGATHGDAVARPEFVAQVRKFLETHKK